MDPTIDSKTDKKLYFLLIILIVFLLIIFQIRSNERIFHFWAEKYFGIRRYKSEKIDTRKKDKKLKARKKDINKIKL